MDSGKGNSAKVPASGERHRSLVSSGAFRLLAFLAFLAVLAATFDAMITHGLRKIGTSKFGAFNRVMNGEVNAGILITGSSRALSHYDPRVIEAATGLSAFNFGMNASQIDFQLAVLRVYLKHNRAPRLVVQNLDLFSFETTKKGLIYDPGYYVPYLYESELYEFFRRVDQSVWKWKYIPLYGYAVADMRFTWVAGLLGCVGVFGREDYFKGFNPRQQVWNEDFNRLRAAVATEGLRYEVMPEGLQAMEAVINLCEQSGISIVLVYSPEYHEMQALETNRPEIMDRFRKIASNHDIPFWDYSDLDICKNRDLFTNSQHLNATGAAAFSHDVASRLAREIFSAGTGKAARASGH